MISREISKYSLKNLWKNKGRSFLTVLSIFAGITTIFIFVSFGLGLYNYIDDITTGSSANKIVIQSKGIGPVGTSSFQLNKDDLEEVRGSQGIREAVGFSITSVEVRRRGEVSSVFLSAYDPEKPMFMELFDAQVIGGKELQKGDMREVILGYNYLEDKEIFAKGLEVNDEIEIKGERVRVAGFMEKIGNPQDDANVYITNDYYEELFPEKKDTYTWIIGEVEDVKEIDRVIEEVGGNLRRLRDVEEGKESFFVQSYQEMLDSYTAALDVVVGFVILIALISILVSAVNTANTMITSVLERVKEIGIMKAVGAKNSEVFILFLFESSLLGLIGGLLGVGLGFILSYVGGLILLDLGWSFLQPAFPSYLFGGCIGFAIITGAISGVVPAWNASNQDPVDALRYE